MYSTRRIHEWHNPFIFDMTHACDLMTQSSLWGCHRHVSYMHVSLRAIHVTQPRNYEWLPHENSSKESCWLSVVMFTLSLWDYVNRSVSLNLFLSKLRRRAVSCWKWVSELIQWHQHTHFISRSHFHKTKCAVSKIFHWIKMRHSNKMCCRSDFFWLIPDGLFVLLM